MKVKSSSRKNLRMSLRKVAVFVAFTAAVCSAVLAAALSATISADASKSIYQPIPSQSSKQYAQQLIYNSHSPYSDALAALSQPSPAQNLGLPHALDNQAFDNALDNQLLNNNLIYQPIQIQLAQSNVPTIRNVNVTVWEVENPASFPNAEFYWERGRPVTTSEYDTASSSYNDVISTLWHDIPNLLGGAQSGNRYVERPVDFAAFSRSGRYTHIRVRAESSAATITSAASAAYGDEFVISPLQENNNECACLEAEIIGIQGNERTKNDTTCTTRKTFCVARDGVVASRQTLACHGCNTRLTELGATGMMTINWVRYGPSNYNAFPDTAPASIDKSASAAVGAFTPTNSSYTYNYNFNASDAKNFPYVGAFIVYTNAGNVATLHIPPVRVWRFHPNNQPAANESPDAKDDALNRSAFAPFGVITKQDNVAFSRAGYVVNATNNVVGYLGTPNLTGRPTVIWEVGETETGPFVPMPNSRGHILSLRTQSEAISRHRINGRWYPYMRVVLWDGTDLSPFDIGSRYQNRLTTRAINGLKDYTGLDTVTPATNPCPDVSEYIRDGRIHRGTDNEQRTYYTNHPIVLPCLQKFDDSPVVRIPIINNIYQRELNPVRITTSRYNLYTAYFVPIRNTNDISSLRGGVGNIAQYRAITLRNFYTVGAPPAVEYRERPTSGYRYVEYNIPRNGAVRASGESFAQTLLAWDYRNTFIGGYVAHYSGLDGQQSRIVDNTLIAQNFVRVVGFSDTPQLRGTISIDFTNGALTIDQDIKVTNLLNHDDMIYMQSRGQVTLEFQEGESQDHNHPSWRKLDVGAVDSLDNVYSGNFMNSYRYVRLQLRETDLVRSPLDNYQPIEINSNIVDTGGIGAAARIVARDGALIAAVNREQIPQGAVVRYAWSSKNSPSSSQTNLNMFTDAEAGLLSVYVPTATQLRDVYEFILSVSVVGGNALYGGSFLAQRPNTGSLSLYFPSAPTINGIAELDIRPVSPVRSVFDAPITAFADIFRGAPTGRQNRLFHREVGNDTVGYRTLLDGNENFGNGWWRQTIVANHFSDYDLSEQLYYRMRYSTARIDGELQYATLSIAINQPTEGELQVQRLDSQLRPGAKISLNVFNLRDANGLDGVRTLTTFVRGSQVVTRTTVIGGNVRYQWFYSPDAIPESRVRTGISGNGDVFQLSANEYIITTNPSGNMEGRLAPLYARAVGEDLLGFPFTSALQTVISPNEANTAVIPIVEDVAIWSDIGEGVFSVNIAETSTGGSTGAAGATIQYQWQVSSPYIDGDGNRQVEWIVPFPESQYPGDTIYNGRLATLEVRKDLWNREWESLRLVAWQVSGIGGNRVRGYISDVVQVAQDPVGEPRMVAEAVTTSSGGGTPTAFTRFLVDVSAVQDANGIEQFGYEWFNPNGESESGGRLGYVEDDNTYILGAGRVTELTNGGRLPSVVIQMEDDYGFRHYFTLTAHTGGVRIATNNTAKQLRGELFNTVPSIPVSGATYQWYDAMVDSTGGTVRAGAFREISGATSQTYMPDLNSSRPFVRLSVGYTETIGGRASNAAAISQPFYLGEVSGAITGEGNSSNSTHGSAGGDSYSVDTSGLTDIFGDAIAVTVVWQRGLADPNGALASALRQRNPNVIVGGGTKFPTVWNSVATSTLYTINATGTPESLFGLEFYNGGNQDPDSLAERERLARHVLRASVVGYSNFREVTTTLCLITCIEDVTTEPAHIYEVTLRNRETSMQTLTAIAEQNGARYSVSVIIADENGIGDLWFDWSLTRGGQTVLLHLGTNHVHEIDGNLPSLPGSGDHTVLISMFVHVDRAGLYNRYVVDGGTRVSPVATITLMNSTNPSAPPIASIRGTDLSPGATLTALLSRHYSDNLNYQWGRLNSGTHTPIGGATSQHYVIPSGNWGTDELYVEIADTGAGLDITSQGFQMNRDSAVDGRIIGLANNWTAGAVLSANYAEVLAGDPNNNAANLGSVNDYSWIETTGVSPNQRSIEIGANSTLRLDADVLSRLSGGGTLEIRARFTDALGFQGVVEATAVGTFNYVRAARHLNVVGGITTRQVTGILVDTSTSQRDNLNYAWEQGNADGDYTIIGGASGRILNVPVRPNYDNPFVRLLARYNTPQGSVTVRSAPVAIYGLTSTAAPRGSVTVAIADLGIISSGTALAVTISNLRDIWDNSTEFISSDNTSAPYAYRWQHSDNLNGPYTDLRDVQPTYVIDANVDNNANIIKTQRYVRAIVSDRTGLYSGQVVAASYDTHRPFLINGSESGTFTVRVDNAANQLVSYHVDGNTLSDANGVRRISYSWNLSVELDFPSSPDEITMSVFSNQPTFEFSATDPRVVAFVRNAQAGTIFAIASAQFVDGLNVTHMVMAAPQALVTLASSNFGTPAAIANNALFVPDINNADNNYGPGATITADISQVSDAEGIAGYTYLWETSTDGSTWTALGTETAAASVFILPNNWDGRNRFLRYQLAVRDRNGDITRLTSGQLELNKPATGSAMIQPAFGQNYEGSVLQVVQNDLQDPNGGPRYTTPRWFRINSQANTATQIGTGASYVIKEADVNSDATNPFQIAASLSYIDSLNFTTNLITLSFATRMLRVSAVAVLDGVMLSAQVINEGDFGQNLALVWQNSNSSSGPFTDIANANRAVYEVLRNFDTTRPYFRVKMTYTNPRTANSIEVFSNAVFFERNSAPTGNVDIVASPNASGFLHAPGAVFSADLRNINDENGGAGQFGYLWRLLGYDSRNVLIHEHTVSVVAGGNATYTLLAENFYSDFSNDITVARYSVQLQARQDRDGDGLSGLGTFTALRTIEPQSNVGRGGIVNIEGDQFYVNGKFTAALTNPFQSNGIRNMTYQWYAVAADGVSVALSNNNGMEYQITSWSGSPQIQAVALYYDIFKRSIFVTSQLIMLNAEPTGQAVVDVDGGQIQVGTRLQVNLDGVTDVNGLDTQGRTTYRWRNVQSTPNDQNVYVLSAQDVSNILSGGTPIYVELNYIDGLGFAATLLATVKTSLDGADGIEVRLDGRTLRANVVADIGSARQVISWQRGNGLAGNAAVYENINFTGAEYVVPSDYPVDKPFVRARVSYTSRGAAVTIFSPPVRVIGVESGEVQIVGTGYGAGADYRAELADLRDILGQEVESDMVNYQWQSGNMASGSWQNISGATAQNYRLNTADFANGREYLRLIISDIGSAYTASQATLTAVVEINMPTEGSVRINRPFAVEQGAFYRANTQGVRDANGIGTYTYTWYRRIDGGVLQPINNVRGDAYPLNASDFRSSQSAELVVSVRHTDAFGFLQAGEFGAAILIKPQSIQGEVNISGSGYVIGSEYVGNLNIISGDSKGATAYQWGRSSSADVDEDNFTIIGGATNARYALTRVSGDTGTQDYLALRVVYTDSFSNRITLYSSGQRINQPTQGALAMSSGASASKVGDRVTVLAGTITDENNNTGQGSLSDYEWINGEGTRVASSAEYVVQARDISLSGLGQHISIFATYEDGAGYRSRMSIVFAVYGESLLERKEVMEEMGAVLDVLDTQSAVAAIGGRLNSVSGIDVGNVDGEGFIEINGQRLLGYDNVLSALGNRTANSVNRDKDLAIDSFAVASGGELRDGSGWGLWARGGFYALEGAPVVSANTLSYEGKSRGIYAGFDRQLGDARVGFAVGKSQVDLDAALTDQSTLKEDKVRREILALMPYIDFQFTDAKLRLMSGYGKGESEVTQRGRCAMEGDVEWFFGAASGEIALAQMSSGLGFSVVGDVSYGSSSTDSVRCGVFSLPGSDTAGGEWVVGGVMDFDISSPWRNYALSPRLGVDVRQLFGDISDDLSYDLSGGMLFGGKDLSFDIEGQVQLNEGAHRRHSLSGTAQYREGRTHGLNSSWRTKYDRKDGLLHRWQLGYGNRWGMNTIGVNFHVERRLQSDSPTDFGAEAQVKF